MICTSSAGSPLSEGSQQRLLLRDVARITPGTLDDDARFAIDGERAIAVQVFKTTEANTVDVVAQVLAAAEELRRDLPDLEIVVGEESATFTEISIGNLLDNVWQALALAAAIIFLFIGRARASAVVMACRCRCRSGSPFGLMRLAGVELNMVTLSA
jgi:multidrug efflux pump subunit AcrB